MHSQQLLDSQSIKELMLLQVLRLNDNRISKLDAYNELSVTPPTLKQLVARINQSYQEVLEAQDCKEDRPPLLTTTRTDILMSASYDDDGMIKSLIAHWLSSSAKVQLLHVLFTEPHVSRAFLAETLNVSFSTLNTLIHQCNDLLAEFKLTISNNKIQGSGQQIFYFFYQLYWLHHCYSETPLIECNENYGFADFIKSTLNYRLSILQIKRINILFALLAKQQCNICHHFVPYKHEALYQQVTKTTLFTYLRVYFAANWDQLNSAECDYYAFITFLFITSHNMLDFTEVKLTGLHSQCLSIVDVLMKLIDHYYYIDDRRSIIESDLYYACNRINYYEGNMVLLDSVTYSTSVAKHVSLYGRKLIESFLHSHCFSAAPFCTAHREELAALLYLIVHGLEGRKKVQLKIGIITKIPPLLLHARLEELWRDLAGHFNLQFSEYHPDKDYDLIISDIYKADLGSDTTPLYTISSLYLPLDTENFRAILENIEAHKFRGLFF